MLKTVLLSCLFAALAAGITVFVMLRYYPREQKSPAEQETVWVTPPAPVYDWKLEKSETIALEGGQVWRIGPIPTSTLGNEKMSMRLKVTSTIPVTTGFIPTSWQESVTNDPDVLTNPTNLANMPCSRTASYSTDIQCTLGADIGDVYFIAYDSRTKLGAIAAGVLGAFGAKSAVDEATATNKVSVNVYIWECVQNCPQSTGAVN